MSNKIKPARSLAPTHPPAIFNYDRFTLWLSHPDFPISLYDLKSHCTDAKLRVQKMPFNPNWKAKLEIFQPTRKCLVLLEKALGNEISTMPTYVELACDRPADCGKEARRWCDCFLSSARMLHQRQAVVHNGSIWYFGDRFNENGERRINKVLAVYADKPSKLNNARPDPHLSPDLHIEYRVTGSSALSKQGICCVHDLLGFDHMGFWNRSIRMFQLPKPTELGKFLAKASGADAEASGTALRKRAARWIAKHSIGGQFIMHNALHATPKIIPFLSTVPFTTWLEDITSKKKTDWQGRY